MRVIVAQDRGEKPPDDVLPEPPPVHHDLDYVMATWLQHRIHHTYPRAGGYDDQDELLMMDWHTLNLYYSRVEAGQFTTFNLSGFRRQAQAWSEMAGE